MIVARSASVPGVLYAPAMVVGQVGAVWDGYAMRWLPEPYDIVLRVRTEGWSWELQNGGYLTQAWVASDLPSKALRARNWQGVPV